MKKGGYKNYCKSIREEWKKKGEKVPVPEQGKRLCVARAYQTFPLPSRRPYQTYPLFASFLYRCAARPPPFRSGAGWKALSDAEKDKFMD